MTQSRHVGAVGDAAEDETPYQSMGCPRVQNVLKRSEPQLGSKGVAMQLIAIVLSLALINVSGWSVPEAEIQPDVPGSPNVLVVLVDDLAEIDDRLWQTMPNIRETFLEQGLTFSDAHVETPLCCPGRAGYLTGLHTFNHGVIENDLTPFDDSMTVATQAQGAGYFTFWVGKYLNGYGKIAPYVPAGWDRFYAMQPRYYDYNIWRNGRARPQKRGDRPSDYSTDVARNIALNTLSRVPAGQPFLGFVSLVAPHVPTIPPRRHLDDPRCAAVAPWAPASYNEEDVSDKPAHIRSRPPLTAPAWDLTAICGTLLAVDDLIGALRDELADQGRLDNTLLVLTSDNGMDFGAHRLRTKSSPYSTQVPLMVSWPAALPEPRRVSEQVLNIDLAPTVCELAGCVMGPYPNGQPGPDGLSIVPLLLGSGGVGRDAFLTNKPVAGGIVPSWFAVSTTAHSPMAQKGCALASEGGCRWHYVEYGTGETELYDVSNGPCWEWREGMSGDPCELDNVAGSSRYKHVQGHLRDRLAALMSEGGPP